MQYPLSKEDQYPGKIRFIAVSDPTVDIRTLEGYVNSFKKALPEFASSAQAAANEFAGGDVVLGEFGGTPTAGSRAEAIAKQAAAEAKVGLDAFGDRISSVGDDIRSNLTLTPPKRRAGVVGQRTTKTYDFSNAITLYLPQAITIGDGVEYERFDFGVLGSMALGAVQGGSGLTKALADAIMNEGANAIDMIKGDFSGMNKQLASLAAVRALQRLPGQTAGAVGRAATGVTTNPNTKTLFKAVNLRTFTFNFKMIASSRAEAREIDAIVKYFRREMYPDLIQVDNLPLGYVFPKRFKVDLTYNGQKVPIKFLESNLLSMNTTYNPSSMGWHEDGMPSEIDMSLTFGEPRTVSRRDFETGGELS